MNKNNLYSFWLPSGLVKSWFDFFEPGPPLHLIFLLTTFNQDNPGWQGWLPHQEMPTELFIARRIFPLLLSFSDEFTCAYLTVVFTGEVWCATHGSSHKHKMGLVLVGFWQFYIPGYIPKFIFGWRLKPFGAISAPYSPRVSSPQFYGDGAILWTMPWGCHGLPSVALVGRCMFLPSLADFWQRTRQEISKASFVHSWRLA